MNICPSHGKTCYDSKNDADRAVGKIAQRLGQRGHSYKCPHCQLWHIASGARYKTYNDAKRDIKQ